MCYLGEGCCNHVWFLQVVALKELSVEAVRAHYSEKYSAEIEEEDDTLIKVGPCC